MHKSRRDAIRLFDFVVAIMVELGSESERSSTTLGMQHILTDV